MATQDLNQLYQTAMNAFRRATPIPQGLFGATQYPNQGGLTTLPPGAGQVKQPAEFLPGGGIIQPKPLIPRQSIIESDDIEQPTPWKHTAVMPPKGHRYEYSEDGQRTTVPLPPGSWDEDNPWGFTIQPLDSKLEALQSEYKTKEPISLTSENAAQYGFTPPDPNMAGAQVMQYWDKHGNVSYQKTPETVYQGTGYSRPEVWAMANGGIVGLDYLTRRL